VRADSKTPSFISRKKGIGFFCRDRGQNGPSEDRGKKEGADCSGNRETVRLRLGFQQKRRKRRRRERHVPRLAVSATGHRREKGHSSHLGKRGGEGFQSEVLGYHRWRGDDRIQKGRGTGVCHSERNTQASSAYLYLLKRKSTTHGESLISVPGFRGF